MPYAALTGLLWTVVQAAPGGVGLAQPSLASPLLLVDIRFEGGSESDHMFARRAMAVQLGKPLTADELETALVAVRATDRFRSVKGRLDPGRGGVVLQMELDAWPEVRSLTFRGDQPLSFKKQLFFEMRRRTRPGDFRIARWVEEAEQKLWESGYPKATVRIWREEHDTRLIAEVKAGPPTLILSTKVEGNLGPYNEDQILKVAGIRSGRTLWTQDLEREAQKRLRQHLVKDKRLEGETKLQWKADSGLLTLRVDAGPRVILHFEGSWYLWWKKRKELIPLDRAGSYSLELLNEGDQRILHYLRSMGYLDGMVTHRKEIISDDEVRITFVIQPGRQQRIDRLRFEGNAAVSKRDLRKAADLPKGHLGLAGSPLATPELIGKLEERIKDFYWKLGYAAVVLRRQPLERDGNKTTLPFLINEKAQRTIRQLVLAVPEGEDWHAWTLAECLALTLCDRPAVSAIQTGSSRRYKGDRRATQDVTAVIQESPDPSKPGMRLFTLTPSRPIPFIRNDLALVFSALRQRAGALGASPLSRPKFEEDEQGTSIRFDVEQQSLEKVHRLVVQGSDRTKAKAVFRELQLDPESPLAPDPLGKAQSNLNSLGVFQRFDLTSLNAEGVEEAQGRSWEKGDLLLRVAERPPWVITSGFGYDKSQGYHVDLGAERLNVGGMGRTLDFGIRAGDATIHNPTLKKLFDTGKYNRSVDMFSVGYSDPAFASDWFTHRTRFRTVAAYLEEHQDVYLLRRRRVISELEWRLNPKVAIQAGYRFERSDVKPAFDDISPVELALVSRSPARSIVSAPFLQMIRDTRDSVLDPKEGSFTSLRIELAAQLFGTDTHSSFLKMDVKQQWHWGLGSDASHGVVTLGLRLGAARPTASTSQDLPLSERFFAGGPTTYRGVEPDYLGPFNGIALRDPHDPTMILEKDGVPQWKAIPLGGQALALVNLEYRFPLFGQKVWGEVFVDSGQVYQYLQPRNAVEKKAAADADEARNVPERYRMNSANFPPFQTALGLGLIFKIGLPIKIEYAADLKRILGKPRSQLQHETQLKGLLISAGFQF